MRVVETPVPIEELEEIRERKRIVVELVLLKKDREERYTTQQGSDTGKSGGDRALYRVPHAFEGRGLAIL
ncbi:hypothetical protein [Thermococcus sp.]